MGNGAASPRLCGCGRVEWRQAFANRIVPSLRAFGPDLILLSAGFDGGCGDIGNSKLDVKVRGACFQPHTSALLSESILMNLMEPFEPH